MHRVLQPKPKLQPARARPVVQRARGRGHSASAPTPRFGLAPASPRSGLAATEPRSAPANGLPEPLKSRMESMSGLALDDVRIYRHSSAPVALNAHAFTRGTDIHLGPGQERHLAHEAWHVVQQKQGRVRATTQLKGEAVNDDAGLEAEADAMASRARQPQSPLEHPPAPGPFLGRSGPVQRAVATREEIEEQIKKYPGEALDHQIAELEVTRDGQLVLERVSFLYGTRIVLRYYKDEGDRRGPYWKAVKLKRGAGAAGQWGRLTEIEDSATVAAFKKLTLLLLWFGTVMSQAKSVSFKAKPTSSARDDATGRVMAEYFLGNKNPPLPAKVYALKRFGVPGYEWLHMHAHGLGGPDHADNLWAGSHAANSEMLAMESAVKTIAQVQKVDVDVTPTCESGHHSQENCYRIADLLGLDKKDVYERMKSKESHLLRTVTYSARATGTITALINATQGGYYLKGGFTSLETQTRNALVKGGHRHVTRDLAADWGLKLLVLLLVAVSLIHYLPRLMAGPQSPQPEA